MHPEKATSYIVDVELMRPSQYSSLTLYRRPTLTPWPDGMLPVYRIQQSYDGVYMVKVCVPKGIRRWM